MNYEQYNKWGLEREASENLPSSTVEMMALQCILAVRGFHLFRKLLKCCTTRSREKVVVGHICLHHNHQWKL